MNGYSDHDLAGAYVLDALLDEERSSYELHLQSCSECRAEVAELRPVVNVLSLACEEIEPSDQLRDRVMLAIEEEGKDRPALVPLVGGRPEPRPRRSWRVPQIGAGLAAAVLLAGLGFWNLHLQQQINQNHVALEYQRQLESAIASNAAVSPIASTADAQGASAALVQPRGAQPAYLIVQGLPATPSQRVYELWFMRGTAVQAAKVFTYGGSAPQIVRLPAAVQGHPLAAVTIEPGPLGTKAPTGPKVLVGQVRT